MNGYRLNKIDRRERLEKVADEYLGRQDKLSFGAKTTVQCSDQLKHKIPVRFSKKLHCRPKFGR